MMNYFNNEWCALSMKLENFDRKLYFIEDSYNLIAYGNDGIAIKMDLIFDLTKPKLEFDEEQLKKKIK